MERLENVAQLPSERQIESTDFATNLKGKWNEFKGVLKEKYAELTDDDLLYEEGKEDQLYGKLQQRLGKSKEEINDIFEDTSFTTNVKGRWNEIKGKVKQEYANLTDDDLLYVEGKENELYGKLQRAMGKTKSEVNNFISKL